MVFSDWWMRICQRNVFNCVAKSIMSGIKICKANAPTALPMDHTAEIHQTEPTWNYSHLAYVDPPRMVDLHPSNLNPNTNDTMGTMISTTLNTDPLTYSDVRPRLTSNNSSRCSELNSGPHLQDTFAPRKSSRNVRRQNMMLNIEGYKKFVRKCRKQATYSDNLQILCQGRKDNPLHIQLLLMNWSRIWRKKIQHGVTPCLIVNAQCLGHSLWMRIVIEVTKIWYLRQEVFN